MELCDLIATLEACDPDTRVPLGFGNPHSYRGCYDELAFEPVRNTTVGEMLTCAKESLGRSFSGYKGGEYTMTAYTGCWLAEHGRTGEGIGPVLLAYMTGHVDGYRTECEHDADEFCAVAMEG